ncbi:MAG: hypothetical protein H6983_25865 [Ectothiorhodospiraceae bacterium]|nr:hypothetical protein [Ectothiorhodospiraceae bacterium]
MLDLSGRPDPVEILSVAGGQRATDSLEVFPKVIRRDDGSFQCRFFVHGCRYVSAAARERVETLSAGEELVVALELNNPASGLAAQLQSNCVRELRITGLRTPRYNRRADLVCFVNGLPLVLFELKAVHVNIRAGFAVRGCIEG